MNNGATVGFSLKLKPTSSQLSFLCGILLLKQFTLFFDIRTHRNIQKKLKSVGDHRVKTFDLRKPNDLLSFVKQSDVIISLDTMKEHINDVTRLARNYHKQVIRI